MLLSISNKLLPLSLVSPTRPINTAFNSENLGAWRSKFKSLKVKSEEKSRRPVSWNQEKAKPTLGKLSQHHNRNSRHRRIWMNTFRLFWKTRWGQAQVVEENKPKHDYPPGHFPEGQLHLQSAAQGAPPPTLTHHQITLQHQLNQWYRKHLQCNTTEWDKITSIYCPARVAELRLKQMTEMPTNDRKPSDTNGR